MRAVTYLCRSGSKEAREESGRRGMLSVSEPENRETERVVYA